MILGKERAFGDPVVFFFGIAPEVVMSIKHGDKVVRDPS